jgi:phytoene synthase
MNPLLPPVQLEARRIVHASKSSFAPAFLLLPAGRRADLEIFYAFCRLVDDLADAPGFDAATRREAHEAWREGFLDEGLRGLPGNLRELVQRRRLDPALFLELLEGAATDLAPEVRMATRQELDIYCHRVAGVVGRICLPVFGADPERAADHAETLGRALQYTNILRDTASDWQRGRLYFPLDELAARGLDAAGFINNAGARQAYLEAFAEETAQLFAAASASAPDEDRRALRPARLMAAVYAALLRKMRRGGLRVMETRYRLTAAEKLSAAASGLLEVQ